MIKESLKQILPQAVVNWRRSRSNSKIFKKWQIDGYPLPTPHLYKQLLIQEYRKKHGCSILVETGTYLGDMVEAQKKYFTKIFSIELSSSLYKKAKWRFRRDENVSIFCGDSGKVLPTVMTHVTELAIFWLDGHYSKGITARGEKDCPIYEELEAIFNAGTADHVLLIDDARCFDGTNGYPSISELTNILKRRNQNYQISIKHDIIRAEILNNHMVAKINC